MSDIIRIGKISSINYENGTARITYEDRDDSTTAEMPFLSLEYKMPQVEDMVLVAHLSNGTSAAVILGSFWHDGHRPQESGADLYRKDYDEGVAYERYAPPDGLSFHVGGCIVRITKAGVEISGATSVKLSGDLQVDGSILAGGDVTGAGVSLNNHTHTSSMSGSSTSSPNKGG